MLGKFFESRGFTICKYAQIISSNQVCTHCNKKIQTLLNKVEVLWEGQKKICQITTLDLSYVVTVKSMVEISQNFVAFSELYKELGSIVIYLGIFTFWHGFRRGE
jgi:hypothetical protein